MQVTEGFIKVADLPSERISAEDKAALNRKANVMFNEGNIEAARRVFTTTGYGDGLTRVGDKYMDKHRPLYALKQYVLAHNKRKSEPIYENLAQLISAMLKDGDNGKV